MTAPVVARRLMLRSTGAALLGLSGCAGRGIVPTPTENTGPNTNVAHWARGAYDYRVISDGRLRGREQWQLFAYADGTRTMIMWHDVFARHSQFTSVLRVGADFRPLEAYVSYWTEAGFKGSGMIVARAGGLDVTANGVAGFTRQSIEIALPYSISTHPIASDGWHSWSYDRARGGAQYGRYFSIEASADLRQPILAKLMPSQRSLIVRKPITVPAGTFEADHFRTGAGGESWIGTRDNIVVRMAFAATGREYVLSEYATNASPVV